MAVAAAGILGLAAAGAAIAQQADPGDANEAALNLPANVTILEHKDPSIRRATAVKEEMVRQGLGADAIAIEGKSFHDPLVPTGPGVREPKNRRAVIDLGG